MFATTMLQKPALVGAALALAVCASTAPAQADDVAGAANAFSKAQKAELSGDPAAAAELFELADSLAPSPEALRSAIRARKAAGQLGSAALDAEALRDRYPNDARSKEVAEATVALAKQTLARYEIRCHPGVCGVVVDNEAATAEPKDKHVLWLESGHHEIVASFGRNRTPAQPVEGAAGSDGTLDFDAPKVEPRPAAGDGSSSSDVAFSTADAGVQPAKGGLPPWVFVTGAVVTVGLGAATVWSGIDTLKAHDRYDRTGPNAQADYDDGVDKQRRTNILIGATAVAGVATGVFAIFTKWKAGPETASRPRFTAGAYPVQEGGVVSVSGVY